MLLRGAQISVTPCWRCSWRCKSRVSVNKIKPQSVTIV